MKFTITANGTTAVTLSPQAYYVVSAEGVFDGANLIFRTVGGVKYLPFRDGEANITEPDAAEILALGASAEIVVADAGGSTSIVVNIDEFKPRR